LRALEIRQLRPDRLDGRLVARNHRQPEAGLEPGNRIDRLPVGAREKNAVDVGIVDSRFDEVDDFVRADPADVAIGENAHTRGLPQFVARLDDALRHAQCEVFLVRCEHGH